MKTLIAYLFIACSCYVSFAQVCFTDDETGSVDTDCTEPAGVTYRDAGSEITLTVDANLTINGDFNIIGENLIVNGTMTVTGTFISGIGSSVTIGNGGTLNVNNIASGLGADFTVESGGSLNVTNNLGTGLFADFTVESGADVFVGGDFVTGGSATTTIDGDLDIVGDFTDAGGSTLTGSGTIDVGGTFGGDDSGFSGVVTDGAPLPVEWVSFEGQEMQGDYVLVWTTASELNNSGFEIQKSIDGDRWRVVDFVEGHGTVNYPINYVYTDTYPGMEAAYYRLKQIDFDGAFEYSPVILYQGDELTRSVSIEVYPNPTFGAVQVRGSFTDYVLYNQEGKLLLQMSGVTSYDAQGRISQALETVDQGTFILKAQADAYISTVRIVKK